MELFSAAWNFLQVLNYADFILPWGRESIKGKYCILVQREELVGSMKCQ